MSVVLKPALEVILAILNFFYWCVVANVVLSWLIAFNIVNTHNDFINKIAEILFRLTEPFLKPLRRILPQFSGVDLSPFAFALIIYFLQRIIFESLYRF